MIEWGTISVCGILISRNNAKGNCFVCFTPNRKEEAHQGGTSCAYKSKVHTQDRLEAVLDKHISSLIYDGNFVRRGNVDS